MVNRSVQSSSGGLGVFAGAMLACTSLGADQIVDSRFGVEEASFGRLDAAALVNSSRDRAGDGPLRIATNQPVALSANNVGVIEDLGDGRVAWRYRISSANAEHINLAFEWDVPVSTQMYLLDADGRSDYRAFGAQDNMSHGELWTPMIEGSFVELYAEVDQAELDAFLDGVALFSVNLGYMPLESAAAINAGARSNACHFDVACPEGDNWSTQISGVARYTVNGNSLCSGSLINNTAEDGRSMFLTAFHCVGSDANPPGNISSFVAYWNFENSFCRTPGGGASGGNGDGSFSQATTGGVTLLSRVSTADTALFEFNNAVNSAYNVTALGWDRTTRTPNSTVGIHHPSGDEKRISIDNDAPFAQPTINLSSVSNIRTWGVDYDIGGLEGGSSGSPLIETNNGRVIAVASGVSSLASNDICANQQQFYGRLNYAWSRGTPETIGRVLDPVGNGTATVLDFFGGSTEPPSSFGAVFPRALDSNVSTTATFDWERSDFADTYDLYIYNDAAGTDEVFSILGLGVTEFTIPANTIDGYSRYYWTVFAQNEIGTTQLSSGNVPFDTVNSGAPASFDVITPAEGDADVPVDTFFAWNAAGGADFYQLRIVNDATGDFIWGPGDGNINATVFMLPDDLPAATTIRWGVIARNASGVNLSDPVFSTFTTAGSAIPTCPADVNQSGAVDIEDLLQVLRDFNTSTAGEYEGSDTDGNAMVDIEDLLLVLREFDVPCP